MASMHGELNKHPVYSLLLVLLRQPVKDGECFFIGGFWHVHWLKASLKCLGHFIHSSKKVPGS